MSQVSVSPATAHGRSHVARTATAADPRWLRRRLVGPDDRCRPRRRVRTLRATGLDQVRSTAKAHHADPGQGPRVRRAHHAVKANTVEGDRRRAARSSGRSPTVTVDLGRELDAGRQRGQQDRDARPFPQTLAKTRDALDKTPHRPGRRPGSQARRRRRGHDDREARILNRAREFSLEAPFRVRAPRTRSRSSLLAALSRPADTGPRPPPRATRRRRPQDGGSPLDGPVATPQLPAPALPPAGRVPPRHAGGHPRVVVARSALRPS